MNSQWTRIQGTAAGTTIVLNRPGELVNVFIPAAKTGTVTFYDNASGTTTATEIFPIVNTGTANHNISLPLRNGLTAVVGGTTDLIVVVN